jgi:hypothetical protein
MADIQGTTAARVATTEVKDLMMAWFVFPRRNSHRESRHSRRGGTRTRAAVFIKRRHRFPCYSSLPHNLLRHHHHGKAASM